MSGSRPIRLPARDFSGRALPVATLRRLESLRVHSTAFPAVAFRKIEAHRFSHPDAPGGLLYLACDLETCLWECFGDSILDPGAIIARAAWENRRLSRVRSGTSLRLCDLTELATRRALGVDQSALKHTDLAVPQAWGLAIQTHPDQVDGIRYLSRFTSRPCLAIFERPGRVSDLAESALGLLPDLDEAEEFLAENFIALA
jgi:hypothetical protein